MSSSIRSQVTIGARTLQGLKRSHNQDRYRADGATGLFLVVDGVGGQTAGAVASDSVAAAIEGFVRDTSGGGHALDALVVDTTLSVDGNRIRGAILSAHKALAHHVADDVTLRGMAATMAMALVDGSRAAVANLGDCRVYILRGGHLTQITRDHSWVAEQVESGALDAEAARVHPRRNVVTRALTGEDVPVIDIHEVDLEPGDTLMLCSDGLHGLVPDHEIEQALLQPADPETICALLIGLADRRGRADDATVVITRVAAPSGRDA